MLNVMNMTGFGGAIEPVSINFVGYTVDGSTATVYTYSSADLGTPRAGRILAIGIAGGSSGNETVSTVTVAGNSATLAVRGTADQRYPVEIWYIEDATNASGDVVVTWASAGNAHNSIHVFEINGATSVTPVDTDETNGSTITLTNASKPMVAIGMARRVGSITGWTGLTDGYVGVQEATQYVASGYTSDTDNSIAASPSAANQFAMAAWE